MHFEKSGLFMGKKAKEMSQKTKQLSFEVYECMKHKNGWRTLHKASVTENAKSIWLHILKKAVVEECEEVKFHSF